MEDYRIIAKAIITDRAGQFGGWMMGNLAQLTNGRNEDCARKAAMAGLSQAMDGHIRPGPGRPAKTPTLPAHAPGATPSYSKVCPKNLNSPQTHEQSKSVSPTAAHILGYQDVAPDEYQGVAPDGKPSKGPLPDLRQNILNFIQTTPLTPNAASPGPVSADKDRQISTENDSSSFANRLHNKELAIPDHPKELQSPAQRQICHSAPGFSNPALAEDGL
jgi:hypothetical protein